MYLRRPFWYGFYTAKSVAAKDLLLFLCLVKLIGKRPFQMKITQPHRATSIKVAEDVDSVIYPKTLSKIQSYADTKFIQIAFAKALRHHNRRSHNENVRVFVCDPGNLLWSSHMISSASWINWWWLKLLRLLAYPLSKPMVCC